MIPALGLIAIAAETQTATAASVDIESILKKGPSLAAIVQVALDQNPQLGEVRARTRAAEARGSATGRLPDLEFKYEQWGVPLSRPYALDEAETLMFGLRQSFPPLGVREARETAAREEARAVSETLEARSQDLILEITRLFSEYYRVDRELSIHRDHIALMTEVVELTRANYRAGRAAQDDVLRAQVELVRLHRDVAHLEQERTSSQAGLNLWMARKPDAPLGSPPEVDIIVRSFDVAKLEELAVQSRAELRANESAIRRSRASMEAAERVSKWPTLMIGLDYWLMPAAEQKHAYGAMISMSLPWLNAKYGDLFREAEASLVADERARDSATNTIRFQVHDALARYQAAREAYTITEERLLPQAEQSFAATRASYSAGATQATAILDAERVLLDVKLDRAKMRAHLAARQAELERAVGVATGAPDAQEIER